jgi:hypothetical protein
MQNVTQTELLLIELLRLKLYLSLLDELKVNYDKDRKILEDRLVTMTREKVDADARARAAFSEALHNDARAKALEKLLR